MEGQEKIQEEAKAEDPSGILRINTEFELKTGIVRVSGHIDNTDLCMKVLVEAAHLILVKNAEKDKARIQASAKTLEIIGNNLKKNGQNENTPPAAVN